MCRNDKVRLHRAQHLLNTNEQQTFNYYSLHAIARGGLVVERRTT